MSMLKLQTPSECRTAAMQLCWSASAGPTTVSLLPDHVLDCHTGFVAGCPAAEKSCIFRQTGPATNPDCSTY
ncbi:hypothetical protein BCV70DRAFT_196784 [Testicularia cyperi]|uniref:Uncharacterized protein n=1 Tax=Testicularia cyperi TaxID=1882483 RepID=A0A317XWB0_9BASI|nr:hypothetical protein BCV70DRAFT_196784 [Testicularia cyperi]